jgi:hypothetical protein
MNIHDMWFHTEEIPANHKKCILCKESQPLTQIMTTKSSNVRHIMGLGAILKGTNQITCPYCKEAEAINSGANKPMCRLFLDYFPIYQLSYMMEIADFTNNATVNIHTKSKVMQTFFGDVLFAEATFVDNELPRRKYYYDVNKNGLSHKYRHDEQTAEKLRELVNKISKLLRHERRADKRKQYFNAHGIFIYED